MPVEPRPPATTDLRVPDDEPTVRKAAQEAPAVPGLPPPVPELLPFVPEGPYSPVPFAEVAGASFTPEGPYSPVSFASPAATPGAAAALDAALVPEARERAPEVRAPEPPLMVRLRDLEREHGWVPLRVEGRLPEDLVGTLYRNGPMKWQGVGAAHWFDGQGAVAAVRLAGGRAEGAVRFVHTPSLDADLAARRPTHGAFRFAMSPRRRLMQLFGVSGLRNLANINVSAWQGRLLAMMEIAPPVELDPDTLESLGETDLDGALLGGLQAHPHRVPARRTTYHVGMRVGREVAVDLYALPDEGAARRLATVKLDGFTELHDFAVTDRYAILVLTPLWTSPLNLLRVGSVERALAWQPERGNEIIVLSLDDGSVLHRFGTEPFFWWHVANAWSPEPRRVELDLIRYPDFAHAVLVQEPVDLPNRPYAPEYVRGHLDLGLERATWTRRWDGRCEFPQVHPLRWTRPHRYAWMAGQRPENGGRGLWDRLVRLDTETGDARWVAPGPRRAVGEPLVVPRGDGGELDAWVLALVWDVEAGATHLGIWDAAAPEAGPVARAFFDQAVPLGLHGTWVPAYG